MGYQTFYQIIKIDYVHVAQLLVQTRQVLPLR
jgi:hypothetical protein